MKMTFRKTKLIDDRPSWQPSLFVCQVGFSGESECYRELVSALKADEGGSFDLVLAKRILRAEDKSRRVFSSCGRKLKTLYQLYSFVSSALFSSENEKSESEERFKPRFKRCFPTSVSSPDCIPALGRKIQKHVLDSVAV